MPALLQLCLIDNLIKEHSCLLMELGPNIWPKTHFQKDFFEQPTIVFKVRVDFNAGCLFLCLQVEVSKQSHFEIFIPATLSWDPDKHNTRPH